MNTLPILEALKSRLNKVSNVVYHELYPFHLKELRDNLFEPMSVEHQKEYGAGNGSELLDKNEKPAKMKALRSSSAMTFNILGNDNIAIFENNHGIPIGKYRVGFEKKLITLKDAHRAPATLDACLLSEDNQTVIFCEMKMMEHSKAKTKPKLDSYLDQDRYFDPSSFKEFEAIFGEINNHNVKKYYDNVQMMKHTLGIYNAIYAQKDGLKSSLAGRYPEFKDVQCIRLINCVWEITYCTPNGNEFDDYFEILDQMHIEKDEFLQSIGPVKSLFRSSLNIDFDMIYMNHFEFISLIKMNKSRSDYLKRYAV